MGYYHHALYSRPEWTLLLTPCTVLTPRVDLVYVDVVVPVQTLPECGAKHCHIHRRGHF